MRVSNEDHRPLEYSSLSLFAPSGFLRNCVIRERLIIDNGLDHLAEVRAQQPIERGFRGFVFPHPAGGSDGIRT